MLTDVNKSLLILKSSADALGSAEAFLRNRGWKIRSTANMKEALVSIIQDQPQFIMLSVDHSNPKVRKLPKILKQVTGGCVIAFAEKNSPSSFNTLNQIGTEYVLYPTITGPAIERIAHKYFRDLETVSADSRRAHEGGPTRNEDGTIAIRGGGKSASDLQSILAQMMSDDGIHGVIAGGSTNLGRTSQDGVRSSLMTTAPTPEEIHADPRSVKKDSLILRGTRSALDNSCKVSGAEAPAPKAIGVTSKVQCLIIESARFSGYLITAMAADIFEEEFMATVRGRLLKFLAENGENLGSGESMNLKINRVPFESWALECAEFLRKSVHEGQDVAMAFFPHSQISAQFQESPSDDMVCMDLQELEAGTIVEFNMYIHLPRNDKYVLYTPQGSVLYHNQKDRLAAQGVSKVHVKKSEIAEIQRYRAQNFLNSKIRLFNDEALPD